MKFASILAVFLIAIVAISQGAPVEDKIGTNLKTLGVSFEDSYGKLVATVEAVNKEFDKKTASFKKEAEAAAKLDNLPVPKFYLSWNAKYKKNVKKLEKTTFKLGKQVAALKAKLGA